MSGPRELAVEPLTAEAFEPFGEVVQAGGTSEPINAGTARQFADLASVDVGDGSTRVSIYRAEPRRLPLPIGMLERHPQGSQLFMPLSGTPYVVVVAPAAAEPDPAAVRAFVATGRQGVNFRRGTWHHPLIALSAGDFLVLDRGGPGENCDEIRLPDGGLLLPEP